MSTDQLIAELRLHIMQMAPHQHARRGGVLLDECKAALVRLREDERRLDWLADKDNPIGQVSLPRECIQLNLTSMRDAIDAAMALKRIPT